ncbi:MAG: cation transporter [Candidatus Raymondbacteria bacterium RifOxyB12_full_50_8]|uniref:Cation transporter n=1 Tax=Candidatus Raymondbacteria bacterium RIFOXYD12_FULL_49_13 TaxID=1817890 RepID=A0A1F7FGM3_UNCRA|nr:MAG: cation transporter [Candidatus Raymondbacteria bacterium RIFOXYA2_FULL_49_16]OGJ99844.1 MAG: cation transporter [Candidatus Raymondbacteria bacterium RifOxyB12_full_50_8]OGK05845.1 MAG: cation transporter [Candidatus Raymondbacteria bacterium RIFOXYD12_FULL_49_13]OGP43338.1 MAG: cation transporter [Candidatus Raymondbacteria bacterium RIFOXYB2_FULL_49_35]
MKFHIIVRYLGFVFLLNAAFLFISFLISAYNHESSFYPLLYASTISLLFGLFPFIFVPPTQFISNAEGIVIVIASWLSSCLLGALPYLLWGGEFNVVNAWFESVSGYTTTGASILNNIEALPMGLLFWRSSTHFLGGIGIIIFVLSFLPPSNCAEKVLFKNETSSLARENFHLRAKLAARVVVIVYLGLVVTQTLVLRACGMSLFDAVNHAFSTVATGGFSTKNLSIAYYDSIPIEATILLFMFLSGINFALLYSALFKRLSFLLKSEIVTYYTGLIAMSVIFVAFFVHGHIYAQWTAAFRFAAFQVVSIATSTGFANADSNVWGAPAKLLLILLTLQAACAGSTSGGIKTDRILLMFKSFWRHIRLTIHPNAVISVRIEGKAVAPSTIEASVIFIAFYICIVSASALALCCMGMDIITAFSGAAACMGNVGPGFGLVSSLGNYSAIPNLGKWLLSVDMILGRLEIFTLVSFFLLLPKMGRETVDAAIFPIASEDPWRPYSSL